jgi:hypothetical protein
MTAPDLLAWLTSLPPSTRDKAIEEHLGIVAPLLSVSPPGEHLIGYHPSGVAPIVHALAEVPVSADDVLVDLGAGLGKVVLLARLLTGATARGIEREAALVTRARRAAAQLDLDVDFTLADAREADLLDGTIFFLYTPFTGPVLAEVLSRLRTIAERRQIVVCALGMDLGRHASWLVRRPIDAFWLTIYDSVVPGAVPRAPRGPSPLEPWADIIACERSLDP